MRVTSVTLDMLHVRRGRKQLVEEGFEMIHENGDPLWELQRGGRTRCRIVDTRIDPDGRTVWVKIESPCAFPGLSE